VHLYIFIVNNLFEIIIVRCCEFIYSPWTGYASKFLGIDGWSHSLDQMTESSGTCIWLVRMYVWLQGIKCLRVQFVICLKWLNVKSLSRYLCQNRSLGLHFTTSRLHTPLLLSFNAMYWDYSAWALIHIVSLWEIPSLTSEPEKIRLQAMQRRYSTKISSCCL
jgi:hypothetical protein